MCVTFGIAVLSGIIGGSIASCRLFNPPHALYRDDEHFEDVLKRYSLSYLEGNDERLTEALNVFKLVKKHIIAKD